MQRYSIRPQRWQVSRIFRYENCSKGLRLKIFPIFNEGNSIQTIFWKKITDEGKNLRLVYFIKSTEGKIGKSFTRRMHTCVANLFLFYFYWNDLSLVIYIGSNNVRFYWWTRAQYKRRYRSELIQRYVHYLRNFVSFLYAPWCIRVYTHAYIRIYFKTVRIMFGLMVWNVMRKITFFYIEMSLSAKKTLLFLY